MVKAVELHRGGRPEEAETIYRQVLSENPYDADALHLMGLIAYQRGKYRMAVKYIAGALAENPSVSVFHYNLSNVLKDLGDLEAAKNHLQEAIKLKADYAEAYLNLGIVLEAQGQGNLAISVYQKVLALQPNHVEAHNRLGLLFKGQREFDKAIEHFKSALRTNPALAEVHNNLGTSLVAKFRVDDAIKAFRKAIQIKPDFPGVHSNLLYNLHYDASMTPGDLFAEHQCWARQHAEPFMSNVQPHTNDHLRNRRLRIGYVSADFRMHPVGHFMEPLLAGHNRARFEVFCYSHVSSPDAKTRCFEHLSDHWRNTSGLTDEKTADFVRHDRIDILVDLGGHTSSNRMLLFARKPAPIQVTYLGYPNTTGLCTVDYRITDRYADPIGQTELLCVEELVRLPAGFLCYKPPQGSPEVAKPPAWDNGCVTFGSFNNLAKVNPAVIESWSRIVLSLPHSRLLIKSSLLGNTETRRRVLALFEKNGVSSDRVELMGAVPTVQEHMACYSKVDIGLDTFPYNGTTTTCEALWMGVPVVAFAGKSHASRVGVSILSCIGLEDLISETPEGYVHMAVKLGGDLASLEGLRKGMRQRMAESSLMDAKGFIQALEAAYSKMWQRWCHSNSGTISAERSLHGICPALSGVVENG
jgi:predicted O-linked N-acetylglucosamine transferase (SPINDLY family)